MQEYIDQNPLSREIAELKGGNVFYADLMNHLYRHYYKHFRPIQLPYTTKLFSGDDYAHWIAKLVGADLSTDDLRKVGEELDVHDWEDIHSLEDFECLDEDVAFRISQAFLEDDLREGESEVLEEEEEMSSELDWFLSKSGYYALGERKNFFVEQERVHEYFADNSFVPANAEEEEFRQRVRHLLLTYPEVAESYFFRILPKGWDVALMNLALVPYGITVEEWFSARKDRQKDFPPVDNAANTITSTGCSGMLCKNESRASE